MVDLAGPNKVSPPDERKRHPRHSTWPSIRTSTTSIWTNLWLHHPRIIGSIKTRETSQECTIKDELGKSLSTSIRNRQHVVISNGTQQIEKLSLRPSVLSHGTERRRIVSSRKPHFSMDTTSTKELWGIMEKGFIRPVNLTFDRYMFLTTEQIKKESIKHFYGTLKEFSENCENTLIRDLLLPICNILKFRKN